MKKNQLANTGIYVSPLCFGSLTMTPFQAKLSIKEGAYLINYAYDRGINFIDTAEIYENYAYIREALKSIRREDYVIASKSYAYSGEGARESLERALKELNTDYIDIFLLHEQESIHTIRGHYEALEYYIRAKEEGKIRALGISSHKLAGVRGAREFKEIEIIHPLVNKKGIGLLDGTIDEMLDLLKECHAMDKGIYAMKALAGGHLISDYEEALAFVRDLDFIDSIAIGIQSKEEIDANIALIKGEKIDETIKERLKEKKRRLIVADHCTACGACRERCQQDAIDIIDGRARANEDCILCGYCATVCPEFAIKVI